MAEPIQEYEITEHASSEMRRPGIEQTLVEAVLAAPEQRHPVRAGRDVLQSTTMLAGKAYLLRVFVDVDRRPAQVVTAYLTSRIGKYWRGLL